MKRHILFFVACLLLLMTSGIAAAQGTPQQVTDAFADLNSRLSTNYSTSNTRWTWSEELWFNRALGCSRLDSASLAYEEIRGFRVQIDIELTGAQSWDYDYRVSYNPNILILCSPDLDSTPVPTNTPRPLQPTNTPTTPPTVGPTATPSACGGLTPRLVIGQQARVTAGEQPNNMRSSYGASNQYVGEIPPEGVFTVLDGPRCTVDGAWWQVNYNGIVGWTVEGQGDEYYLEPLDLVATATPQIPVSATPTIEPTPIICDASVPPRLVAGQRARVTPGIPNNVRSGAGTSNQYVGEIPAEAAFTVVAGPICASGFAWWQVDYNGLIGWTPEGQDGEYWLEPELASLEVITTENVGQLSVLAELTRPDISTAHLQWQGADLFVNSVDTITAYRLEDGFAAPGAMQWLGEIFAMMVPEENSQFLDYALIDENIARGLYARNDFSQMTTALLPGLQEPRELGAILPSVFRVSPDGRYAVRAETASGLNNVLFVYDLSSGESWQIQNAPHTQPVQVMTFSPDSQLLITASADLIVIWEVFNWNASVTEANDAILSAQAYPSNEIVYVNQVIFLDNGEEFLVSSSDVALNSYMSRHGLTSGGFASTESETIIWKDMVTFANGDALLGGAYGGEGSLMLWEAAGLQQVSVSGVETLTAVRDMALSVDRRLLAIQTDTRILILGVPVQP